MAIWIGVALTNQISNSIAVGHMYPLGRRSMAANQLSLTGGLHQSQLAFFVRASPGFL